jgi:hypothetical protein
MNGKKWEDREQGCKRERARCGAVRVRTGSTGLPSGGGCVNGSPEPNWQIGNVVLMLMFERVKLPSRDLAPVITATKKGRPRPNILID